MTMRLTVLAMLGLVVGGAACNSSTAARVRATPAVTATPAPSATTTSSPTLPPGIAPTAAVTPPAATDQPAGGAPVLTFTGSVAGQATAVTSAGSCGRAPAGFAAELHFSVAGQPYALTIALLDYSGPGSYTIPPERVSVRTGQAPGGQLLPATRGSLTVDAGERSGRIDAVIGDGGTRVSGSWACS